MDQLRNTSYSELNTAMAWISFFAMFVSGGFLLIVTLPIWLLLNVLKFGIELYDSAQERISFYQKWAQLKANIVGITSDKYFDVLLKLLEEIDSSKKPAKLGSKEKWAYLHRNPEIALKVYTLIASLDESTISPSKQKIKALSIMGLNKIENSFQYVFQVFERTVDRKTKYQLAGTLAKIAGTAQSRSLFAFIEYIIKDYTYLREDLMNSISSRAQDFNQDEIREILKLAAFPYQSKQVDFYLHRTRYFFNNAFDRSIKEFREDAQVWLTKILQDFFDSKYPSRHYLSNEKINEESGILLAIACRELKEYKKAIAALERVLWLKPNSSSAVMQLVYVYELMEDFEGAKKVLIKVRTQVASNEWFQSKLREYDLV